MDFLPNLIDYFKSHFKYSDSKILTGRKKQNDLQGNLFPALNPLGLRIRWSSSHCVCGTCVLEMQYNPNMK